MRLGLSHHFFEKENNAPMHTNPRTGEKSNGWALAAFTVAQIGAEGLSKHILAGGAFSVGHYRKNWRSEANFISSEIIGFDFDNNVSTADCLKDSFIKRHAFLVYATPSSTPDRPRTRVVMALDEPIVDVDTYKRFWKRLARFLKVGNPDEQCKDAARFFYGSKTLDYYHNYNAILPVAALEALPPHPDELEKPKTLAQPDHEPEERERPLLEAYARKAKERIMARLETLPDGMDMRHGAINSAVMTLASFSKGGWDGVAGWEDQIHELGRKWGRAEQEIDASIRGAYLKADPRPLALPNRSDDETVEAGTVVPAEDGVVNWRSSDESMERYRERLAGTYDPSMTPLIFPFKSLHKKGGFCVAAPPGVLIGIVGMSGALKTSFLEVITEMWRQELSCDILWWGIEWSWEKMADRAIQRMGTLEQPTPKVEDVMLNEIWDSEEVQGVPMDQRHGKKMSSILEKNALDATHRIESWLGKCHYIEQVDLSLDVLLDSAREKIDAERKKGRNVRVFVFDYVQLINMHDVHKENELITRALSRIKAFCIEQKLIGVVASQVTKTSSSVARKGDDVLEGEDGQNFRSDKFNLVLTLNPVYVRKLMTDRAIINVSKNSAGSTGKVMTGIDPSRYKWIDIEIPMTDDHAPPDEEEPIDVPF